MTDPRLDRKVQFDERSRRYQLRTYLDAMPAAARMRGRGWTPGRCLDQRHEGACVAFMCAHRRNGKPISGNVTETQARAYYRRCLQVDEFPGERDEGTSILAGMKVGREMGWWKEYRWAGAGSGSVIDDFIDGTIDIGPGCLGLPWKDSMMEPRPSGVLDCSGAVIGGHAICAPSVRLRMRLKGEWTGTKEVAILQQSWGEEHGVGMFGQSGGFVIIKLDDLEALLEDDGECAFPIEVPWT